MVNNYFSSEYEQDFYATVTGYYLVVRFSGNICKIIFFYIINVIAYFYFSNA